MKVMVVDDMPSARNMLVRILKDIEEVEEIEAFSDAVSALEYLRGNEVDFMFLDIEMPEVNGLDLAKSLDELKNPPHIAFVTAYADYALEAWKTRAIGYVLKPFNKKEIKEVIEKYKGLRPRGLVAFEEGSSNSDIRQTSELKGQELKDQQTRKIEIMCFPGFDIFVNKKPIAFRSKKAKELLAFLVHNKGQWVNVNTLCFILMGDMDEVKAQNNLRAYLTRLRRELSEAGILDLLQQDYGKCRVNTGIFTCDYYEYIKGNHNLFSGEYMFEYSWAEAVKEAIIRNK